MKQYFRHLLFYIVSFCLMFLASSALSAVDRSQIAKKMKTTAIPFIDNMGQVNSDVSFYANTLGGTLFVTKSGELVYNLPKIDAFASEDNNEKKVLRYRGGVVLREHLVNSKVAVIAPIQKAEAKVNYFKGNDSKKWQTEIPTFEELTLGEVYKGIEMRLKAFGDNVEKLFYVSPGGDPSLIKLAVTGANDLQVLDTGELEASTSLGGVRFTRPIAWQEKDGKRVQVAANYKIVSNDEECSYAFQVGSYDMSSPLIIDPLLASTYIGGAFYDYGNSITLDNVGNVYVTGQSLSTDYPTTSGAYDQTNNGNNDTVISKLSADLSTLLASTYLGGGSGESGSSIALDNSGNVYVTGVSNSTDYPTTSGAYDQTHNGGTDIVISKLSVDLSTLLASTYLGGGPNYPKDTDYGNSIALDNSGNVYVTGNSLSTDYPTTSGAYDQTHNGGTDIVISKLSGDLTTLLASTYIGGAQSESGNSITMDSFDNIYVAGHGWSTDYPTLSGAYDQTHNGSSDIVISKLSGDLSTLLASTYLGGASGEYARSITLDNSSNVYVAGESGSTDYPTTSEAYDQTHNGRLDIVISKLSTDLSMLLSSTYLGGADFDYGNSIVLDNSGNVYVAGESYSTDYPTTSGAYDQTYYRYGDIVISKLSVDLSTLLASTYLGGRFNDNVRSIAFDNDGNVYVAGETRSPNYPTTSGAYAQTKSGVIDIIISKLSSDLYATYTVSALAGVHGTLDASTPSPQTVTYGKTTQFTFNADSNFYVVSIIGCGINYTNTDETVTSRTETTGAITGDCLVVAKFTPFCWSMFHPAIIGGSCRIASYWGAYTSVCCRSSSATFSVTISGKTKQSYKPACGIRATWEGWEKTTAGEKSVFWQLTSPNCRTYSGTFPWVMEKGKAYQFRLRLVNGKLVIYIYTLDACNVTQNSQATKSQSLPEDTIEMETKSLQQVDKIRLDIPPDAFKTNDLPVGSFQTVP